MFPDRILESGNGLMGVPGNSLTISWSEYIGEYSMCQLLAIGAAHILDKSPVNYSKHSRHWRMEREVAGDARR